jgi:hypothetical protein
MPSRGSLLALLSTWVLGAGVWAAPVAVARPATDLEVRIHQIRNSKDVQELVQIASRLGDPCAQLALQRIIELTPTAGRPRNDVVRSLAETLTLAAL